jgi:hypothetical protein
VNIYAQNGYVSCLQTEEVISIDLTKGARYSKLTINHEPTDAQHKSALCHTNEKSIAIQEKLQEGKEIP